jgi:hypothetical protein
VPDFATWAKTHEKQLMLAGAAGVAGLALFAGKANDAGNSEPAESGGDAAPYAYAPYAGSFDTTAGDLYGDLQPELEQINRGIGDIGETLDDLPEEIGKNIPKPPGGKPRPPQPHGVKHPPQNHHHNGHKGPKHHGPKHGPKPGPKTGKGGKKGTHPYQNGGRPVVHQPTKKAGLSGRFQIGGRPVAHPAVKPAPGLPMPKRSAPIKATAQAQAKKPQRRR